MKRLLPPTLAALLATIAIAAGGSALAYFSSEGTGSAEAAVTKLTVPTITAATPAAGGSVSLTWGAVTPPGSGSVRYYVTRDGGQPAGNCPKAAAPTTGTSCTDGGIAIGEHTYTVTATWETWTAVSGTKTAKVTVGPATQFTITASTTTPAVSASTNLTITARDASGSVVTTYTGSHSLVFSGASASPSGTKPTVVNTSGSAINFGSATALTFTAGVATVSSSKNGLMKLYRAGVTEVSASEGSITTPSPLLLTVSPGTASKFVLAAATTPTAGASDDLTITAQDTYGNTATGYTGSKNLTFTGASASPSGNVPTVTDSSGVDISFGSVTAVAFDAGVASAAEADGGTMKLYKSGSTSIKATEGSVTTPTALTVTVAPGAAFKLLLSGSTTTPVATGTSNLTTTAQDSFGNTATSYTGSKSITFSGASASPSGSLPTVVNSAGTAISFGSATVLNFNTGVASVSSSKNGLLRLPKAGATNIAASDGMIATVSPLALTVSVGAASRLGLTDPIASAGTIGAPCLFTCAITGLGNEGTVIASVSVTDNVGNTVSGLGSGHAVNVTANGGAVSGGVLTIASSGPAVSTTPFTYTAPASGSFTNTITATKSAGTTYTSATATASK